MRISLVLLGIFLVLLGTCLVLLLYFCGQYWQSIGVARPVLHWWRSACAFLLPLPAPRTEHCGGWRQEHLRLFRGKSSRGRDGGGGESWGGAGALRPTSAPSFLPPIPETTSTNSTRNHQKPTAPEITTSNKSLTSTTLYWMGPSLETWHIPFSLNANFTGGEINCCFIGKNYEYWKLTIENVSLPWLPHSHCSQHCDLKQYIFWIYPKCPLNYQISGTCIEVRSFHTHWLDTQKTDCRICKR